MKLETFSNGLRVVLVPCEAESVAVGLFIASGSRHETAKTSGISHFIEHMLFKGTPTRKPIDITRAIEGHGGNFNACTGEESTCYYAHLPCEYLAEAVDILSDMYLRATIPSDEFVREKQVVIEEIRMYADEPDSVAMENLQRALFPKSMLGAPVAGTPKSLKPLKPVDLKRYIRSHYLPSNTVVVIVGNFEEGKALKIVEKAMVGRDVLGTPRRAQRSRPTDGAIADRVVSLVSASKDIAQTQLALGYRTFGIGDNRKYAATVMDAILGRGMSSRLFQEVREKRGLSYDISSRMQFFQDAGMFTVTAGLDPAKAKEALETIDRELKRIREKPVSAAELKRTKDFLIGNFRLSHEKVTSKLFFYGQTMLSFGRLVSPQEQIDGIRAVTAADVKRVASAILRPSNRSVSWVVPKKNRGSSLDEDRKMKRLMVGVFSGLLAATTAFAENAAEIGSVRLKGYLGERLDAMIERHVCGADVDYITSPFMEKTETKGWWQTEFWGKWMHSAVPYLGYCGSKKLRTAIDRGIDRVLASQEPSGYVGNYPDELRCGEGWDVWGMKYTLLGLIHYYDLVKDKAKSKGEGEQRCDQVLSAAKRLCDYVIAEIGPGGKRGRELWQTGGWSGYASSSILEPVVWLYRRTDEKKYLDFATYIVKGMTEPETGPRLLDLALKGVSVADRNGYGNKPETDGGYVAKHNRWKAYEMMSCYQGLLDFVEEKVKVEGEGEQWRDLRLAAVKTAEDIVKEEVNLAGGCACSEAWFHGARKQHLSYRYLQETCVTTTWMRFCEKLLSVTDDPKWADEIERTFYNAYLGAMKSDGSEFEAYTPLTGSRWHGMHHCFMHTDCCTSNGPRGFLCFLKEFFRKSGDTATFNFYASALVDGFDMYSLYPRTDYVRIVSHTTGSQNLRLRIPAWSAKTEVKLNGKVLDGVKAGSYFTIQNDWRLGDIVEVKFDMPVVAHTLEHNVAFTRGPVLLARDSRFADGDLTEPFRWRTIKDGQAMGSFAAVRTPSDDIWMAFSATLPIGSHGENPEGANPLTVFFCDYASAGNAWRRDNYYRTWFPIELGPAD